MLCVPPIATGPDIEQRELFFGLRHFYAGFWQCWLFNCLVSFNTAIKSTSGTSTGGNRRLKMRGLTSASIKTSIYQQNTEKPFLMGIYRRAVLVSGAGLVGAALLALAGCASAPIPTEQLAVSKTQIESATTAGGTEFAPLELKTAREKLDAANRAVAEKDYEKAARLASEAQVDAKLAETKALSAKAQKAVAETQDHLRTMLQEVNRNSQHEQEQLDKKLEQ
jgi:hypothetical protein